MEEETAPKVKIEVLRRADFIIEKRKQVSEEAVDKKNVALINKFAQTELTIDDVYIRSMYLCNDVVDSYFSRFPEESLKKISKLVVGQSVLKGHDYNKLPIARFFKGKVVEKDGISWVRAWFYWLKNTDGAEDLVKNIDGGVYREVSIGFSCSEYICSICEKDIRRCEHIPGEKYKKQDCFYNMTKVEEVLEGSLVFKGAQVGTQLAGERNKLTQEFIDLKKQKNDTEDRAVWDTAYVNDLPDKAFAIILSGGEKDDEGKTTPRSLRKLPHHNKSVTSASENESVDKPHLRNALARWDQTDAPADVKNRAKSHLVKHAKALDIGEYSITENEEDENMSTDTQKSAEEVQSTVVNVDVNVDEVFEKRLADITEELDGVKATLTEKDESIETLTAKNSELTGLIGERDSEVTNLKDELGKIKQAQKEERINNYVEGLKREGKVTPAMEKNAISLLMEAGEEEEVKLKSIFDNMPVAVEMRELSESDGSEVIDLETDDPRAVVDELVKAYEKKHDVDYSTAFDAVMDENPELAEKYANFDSPNDE